MVNACVSALSAVLPPSKSLSVGVAEAVTGKADYPLSGCSKGTEPADGCLGGQSGRPYTLELPAPDHSLGQGDGMVPERAPCGKPNNEEAVVSSAGYSRVSISLSRTDASAN